MNLQPNLENDLVQLRPLIQDDYGPLYQAAKDPLIWIQHPNHDRYNKKEYSNFFTESLDSGGALVVMDKSKNIMIGSSRFHPVEEVENAIEIGWSFLARDYWGGTYNKAVKSLMINYALQYVEYVVFYIGKDNIRSQKVVEKIGGVAITESTYQHLIKKGPDNFTYVITHNTPTIY